MRVVADAWARAHDSRIRVSSRSRSRENAVQFVNVFVERCFNVPPQGIENDASTFPAGQFCGRNEIAVARDKNNCVGLLLQADRGDVHSDAHVHDPLLQTGDKILVGQMPDLPLSLQE